VLHFVTDELKLVSQNFNSSIPLVITISVTAHSATAVWENEQVFEILLLVFYLVEGCQFHEQLSFVLAQEGAHWHEDLVIGVRNERDQKVESHNVKNCCEQEEDYPLEISLIIWIWVFTKELLIAPSKKEKGVSFIRVLAPCVLEIVSKHHVVNEREKQYDEVNEEQERKHITQRLSEHLNHVGECIVYFQDWNGSQS